MSTNWQTRKLGEVCKLIKGKKPSKFVFKSSKPYLTAKTVRGTETPEYAAENCPSSVWVKKEDIVIIMDGSNSGEIFTGLEGALASTMGIVEYQEKLLSPKYILYFLITHRENFTKSRTGSAIPHLNKEEFENLTIPLPLLPEQHRIVKILDEIFANVAKAKENTKKNLQNAKELFESYLQSVFTNLGKDWEGKTLEEIADIEYGYTDKAKYVGDYRYVRITDTDENGLLIQENKLYIKSFKEKDKFLLHSGDLLMARVGASFGNVLFFKSDEPAIFASYLIRIKFKEKIESKLYWYFSKSKLYWDQVKKLSSGSAQPQFNGGALKQIRFYYPKFLSEQKAIVKKMDALMAATKKIEAIHRQKLADLEELKKSVLKKAFAGELVEEKSLVPIAQVAKPSPFILNQVHAAIIDQVAKNGGSTTEVAVAKYDHLLQEVFGLSLGYQFQTQQFGPFDARIKRLVCSGLGANRWFTKRSGMIIFGNNINTLLLRQSNLYRAAQSAMKELTKLGITKLDADKVELLSTICHSIKETKSIVFDEVRKFMSQWPTDGNRTKADKFSSEQAQKCLDFIVKNNWHLKLL